MLKRIIDITLALILTLLSFPFLLIILLIVFIITKENPIFTQIRKVTLDKNPIKLYKIRTIKASKHFFELEKKCDNIFLKTGFDAYVPSFCRWLRKTGIDEIPQVINILKGEMSFVGPRPFPENDLLVLKKYNPEIYYRRTKIFSKPGISGYWQIFGDREQGFDNVIILDEVYETKKSFFFDLSIMLSTISSLLRAKHTDAFIQKKSLYKKFEIPDKIIYPEF